MKKLSSFPKKPLNFHLINEDLNILKILQKSCSENFSDFRSKKPAILSILDHFGQILTHFNQLTMLQKLSKCEVNAWLCWYLIIYRRSDFTWNPILVNSDGPKMSFLTISEVLNFDFSKFEQLSSSKFTKNSKFRVSCQKWHF